MDDDNFMHITVVLQTMLPSKTPLCYVTNHILYDSFILYIQI